MNNDIQIKTFDGDLEALRELLRLAWGHDYSKHKQSVIDFTLSYLRWNLQNPKSNTHFHIGAYHNDMLVGFAASFPQKYEYVSTSGKTISKREVKGVLSTYFTTHKDYRRLGIGTMLAKERIRRHIEQGIEINLFYQDNGHASSKVYPKFSGFMKSTYSNLTTIDFLIKVLDIKKLCKLEYFSRFQEKFFGFFKFLEAYSAVDTNAQSIRKFKKDDINACLNIVNSYTPGNGLFRRWDKDELLWDLESGLSSTLVFLKEQKPVAFISFHLLDMFRRTSDTIAQVDNIFIEELSASEKRAFVNYLTVEVKKTGANMIMVPKLPYFKTGAFYRNRYIPYSRKQHLKLLNYSSDMFLNNCSSIYTYYR